MLRYALLSALLVLASCGPAEFRDGPGGGPGNDIDDTSQIDAALTTGQRLSLKSADGQLLTLNAENIVRATADSATAKAIFTINKIADGRVAIRASNGKYVSAENGGGTYLIANRTEALGWETFSVVHYPGWKISLRSNRGGYVVAVSGGGGAVLATSSTVTENAKFTIVPEKVEVVHEKTFNLAGVRFVNDELVALKPGFIRTDFRWDTHQPTDSTMLTGSFKDDLVIKAHQGGVKVLGVLGGTPRWARQVSCESDPDIAAEEKQHCQAQNVADFARFAGLLARHYKQVNAEGAGVHDWEILNEVNSSLFFRPQPNPERYAQLVIAAAAAIRAEDPAARIVLGSTCPLGIYNPSGEVDPRFMDARIFLQRVYAAGAKNAFDAVSYHPYTWSNLSLAIDENRSWSLMFKDETLPDGSTLKSLRTLMVEAGDAAKTIENTEYGAPTVQLIKKDGSPGPNIDEAKQAELMTTSFNLWKTYPWAGGFYWFNYKDFDTHAPVDEARFHAQHMGIITSDPGVPGCDAMNRPTGTAKKAYCTFKAYPKH